MKQAFCTILLGATLALPLPALAQTLEAQTNQIGSKTTLTTTTVRENGIEKTTDIVMAGSNLGASSIRQIQSALMARNYYSGPINGQWDQATAQAMASYQQKEGISGPQDGMLIKASTLAKLDVTLQPTPEVSVVGPSPEKFAFSDRE
jgi:peptidoglycan hydrolase-like protein with peptidoglycan-binding domain